MLRSSAKADKIFLSEELMRKIEVGEIHVHMGVVLFAPISGDIIGPRHNSEHKYRSSLWIVRIGCGVCGLKAS
jgi:hypothetical protein